MSKINNSDAIERVKKFFNVDITASEFAKTLDEAYFIIAQQAAREGEVSIYNRSVENTMFNLYHFRKILEGD